MSGPAECNTNTHISRSPIAKGPIKEMQDNSLDEQNVIQVHITVVLQKTMGPMKEMLNICLIQQNVIHVHINFVLQVPLDQCKYC